MLSCCVHARAGLKTAYIVTLDMLFRRLILLSNLRYLAAVIFVLVLACFFSRLFCIYARKTRFSLTCTRIYTQLVTVYMYAGQ